MLVVNDSFGVTLETKILINFTLFKMFLLLLVS